MVNSCRGHLRDRRRRTEQAELMVRHPGRQLLGTLLVLPAQQLVDLIPRRLLFLITFSHDTASGTERMLSVIPSSPQGAQKTQNP